MSFIANAVRRMCTSKSECDTQRELMQCKLENLHNQIIALNDNITANEGAWARMSPKGKLTLLSRLEKQIKDFVDLYQQLDDQLFGDDYVLKVMQKILHNTALTRSDIISIDTPISRFGRKTRSARKSRKVARSARKVSKTRSARKIVKQRGKL